jgi:peptidoglycan/xylan/chitin deacetylase (PgdA/CDA1 family)
MQLQIIYERCITIFLIAALFSLWAFPGKSSIGQTAVSKPPLFINNDDPDFLDEKEIRQQVQLNTLPPLSQSVIASKFIRQGAQDKKRVSITFDDGPYSFTEKYINILQEYNVHAAFFLIGIQVEKYPDEAKKIVESGYEIGIHSYNHRQLTAMSINSIEDDFQRSLSAVKKITDSDIRFFRPPFGDFNDTVIDIAKKHKLTTILWCVDPRDWQRDDPDIIAQHVIENAVNGAIILLHEGRKSTLLALPQIIEGLWEKGFDIVSLSELLSDEIV